MPCNSKCCGGHCSPRGGPFLKNYTVSTLRSPSLSVVVEQLWKVTVPQVCFEYTREKRSGSQLGTFLREDSTKSLGLLSPERRAVPGGCEFYFVVLSQRLDPQSGETAHKHGWPGTRGPGSPPRATSWSGSGGDAAHLGLWVLPVMERADWAECPQAKSGDSDLN